MNVSVRPVTDSIVKAMGEVGQAGPDLELSEATVKAVAAMDYLALCAIIDGLNPAPGPNYGPRDYGEMTGALICRVCARPIRCHDVSEFCI